MRKWVWRSPVISIKCHFIIEKIFIEWSTQLWSVFVVFFFFFDYCDRISGIQFIYLYQFLESSLLLLIVTCGFAVFLFPLFLSLQYIHIRNLFDSFTSIEYLEIQIVYYLTRQKQFLQHLTAQTIDTYIRICHLHSSSMKAGLIACCVIVSIDLSVLAYIIIHNVCECCRQIFTITFSARQEKTITSCGITLLFGKWN